MHSRSEVSKLLIVMSFRIPILSTYGFAMGLDISWTNQLLNEVNEWS